VGTHGLVDILCCYRTAVRQERVGLPKPEARVEENAYHSTEGVQTIPEHKPSILPRQVQRASVRSTKLPLQPVLQGDLQGRVLRDTNNTEYACVYRSLTTFCQAGEGADDDH